MAGESGKIIRNIFGKSYKEGESIFKDASKGALDFKSPNENTFYGKKGGKKFAEYEVKENLYDSKITYFSFINSNNNIPISGLEIVIKDSKGNISRQNTNSKGIIEIENHYSSPFTLLNIKHKEVNKPTEKTQINALYNFTDCYTFEKYEPKEISYIKEIKKLNSVKTNKVLLPHAKIKVESGDNLEQYLSASEIKNFDKINKTGFLYDFNWKSRVKDSYYDFDFGREGEIFIPTFDYDIKNLVENKCHVFYLTNHKRSPLGQKIIKDLGILKRNIWDKHLMENFDIINPKKIKASRNRMEFDWGYHTIVLHNSGNGMDPSIQKLHDKHIISNGWEDIGYHYLIGRKDKKESNIYEGRPLIFKGSHASKYNSKKIGILIEGDLEYQWWDKDDDLENEQINLLAKLIFKLKTEIPSIKNLVGHSDVLGKSRSDGCPGEIIHNVMDVFRKKFGLTNKVEND